MQAVPRRTVIAAAAALAGVCVLGLYLGIHGSLERPYAESPAPPPVSGAAQPMTNPAVAAAIEAKPLASEVMPSSAPEAELAEAQPKPKPKPAPSAAAPAASSTPPRSSAPVVVPELYSPDAPAPQPPADEANTPPY